ncbi:MAG: ABC transporter ATP-binding protein [Deferrisomatales bacterium]|nr:ABC transporter ATP-binding protein [Deferrisomatales bacterium]
MPAPSSNREPAAAAPFGTHLWQLVPFARPYRMRIAAGLLSNVAARFCDLLPMVVVGRVVDVIAPGSAGAVPATLTFVGYGLAVLVTFLGLAGFQSVSDYAWSSMAQKIRHDLRVRLYGHLQRLDVAFFEDRQSGDLLSVLSNDVDNLENFFADATTSIVRIAITFVGVYGFLLWLDWRLALLLFAPMPFAVGAVRFFATKVQPQYRRAREAVGAINSIVENNLQGIGVIQAYTAEAPQERRVERQSAEYRDAAIAAARERARFIPLIYGIAGVSFALLIGAGGWLTYAGLGPSLGDYTTFILFATRLVMPLFVFGMLINQIQRSEASARRIVELLAVEPTIRDRPGAVDLDGVPRCVEFHDVHFAYANRAPVLNGVDLRIEPGQVVGVVGPTGAGKSTLIKLLLRYYEPDTGSVRVNGVPLAELSLAGFRRHLGYVSQEAFLFAGTVEENIRLGSPDASPEQVRAAARIAGIAEFIEALPEGFLTVVGERGVKLSGGQRQRISLARAVLRDPPLLILDEATSAVDTRTEEAIQRNLHQFRGGRMTLAVAHRLSTIRQCDEILVLVDGVVVERGTHDGLRAAGGVYADLWQVQSGRAVRQSSDAASPAA